MPRVPKIDELQVAARGMDAVRFTPAEARQSEISRAGEVGGRVRQQSQNFSAAPVSRELRAPQFSDAADRQSMAMGQAISQYSDGLREIGIREADELDRARVTEASNAYLEASLDAQMNPEYGWQTRQALAAMPDKDKGDLSSQRAERLRNTREQLMQSLGNERQKAAFAQYMQDEDMRQHQAIQRHVLQQSQAYKMQSHESGIALAGKMISTGDEETRQRGLAKLEEHLANIGQIQGLEGEALMAVRQQYASPYVSQAIALRINGYDTQGAAMLLAEYEGYLNASDKVQLMESYKTMYEMQEVRQAAEMAFRGGEVDFTASQTGDPYAVFNQGYNRERTKAKLFRKESGNNNTAKNPLSSAYGKAQFIKATWDEFGESEAGMALRAQLGGVKTKSEQWYALRADPQAAEAATDWYLQKNERLLKQAGVPWNDTTAYLAHFRGAGGAIAIYQADPNENARAHLLRVHGKKAGQEIIAANPTVFAQNRTVGDVIAWAAKSMGVEPDGELPSGRPQPRTMMSNAQLKEQARQMWLNDTRKQQMFVSEYASMRDVEIEAREQKHAQEMAAGVAHIWAGGKVTELSPDVLSNIGTEDFTKLLKMEGEVDSVQQGMLKRDSWGTFMTVSEPSNLAKMTREQVIALAPQLGRERAQALVGKWEGLQKAGDGGTKQAKAEKIIIDTTVRKALGEELYQTAKKDGLLVDAMEYRTQEKLNELMPMVDAGEMTREDVLAQIESELRHEFTNDEVKGLLWNSAQTLKPFNEIDVRRPYVPFVAPVPVFSEAAVDPDELLGDVDFYGR